ncbi:Integrase core domain-containing protein [Quadrisphaera granulorum]|uniref:Integrase-like protein n=1 Tax=Quadrisphaera granulorum TaxID=317664 RepID=A0A316A889_9ACTN|nr:integrase-like protein [Quadrisphaera granulorum]SZE96746.1 Integrase core domain-containing protein [Quadrisphaera granulorum]
MVLLAPWQESARGGLLGQLACLGATACYGVSFVYVRRFVTPRGPGAVPVATVQVGITAVLMLLAAPIVATSTVHRVLSRYGLAKLTWLDRASGRVIRRYERERPGELVHVDVKKLGKIPDGGGHRVVGRQIGKARQNAAMRARGTQHRLVTGYHFIHSAVDDHSRLAYSEILTDEKKDTAAGFWTRANAWFTARGITVERVLTDNGSCYRSNAFAAALGDDITHKRTRAYRPQTNGKVERYHRTYADEWAYAVAYASDTDRNAAFQL